LKQKAIIQKSISVLLLLTFVISVAPKVYFHDLLADHKDFSDCRQLHHSTVLHHQGINCHFDDLVVTAPFLLQAAVIFTPFDVYFEQNHSSFYSSSLTCFSDYKESRGPPSA
jgi:hypothetical protein